MGAACGTTEATDPPGKFLSAEELIAAYDAMTDTDKFKLDRIDAVRRGAPA